MGGRSSPQNDYLVGLSIDGPRELHDAYRHDKAGNPVFDRVLAAARLLQAHHVEFNVMCTINAVNAAHPLEVYRFFRDELEARYIQFIPIVEIETPPTETRPGTVTDRSVQPEAYGRFLTTIFDEWVHRDVGSMFVQFFDGVLAAYVRGFSSLCVLQPTCGEGVALEHNGDLYSCDHFVDAQHLLGNIVETPLGELVRSDRAARVRRSQTRAAPGILPVLRLPVRLQRGVPQEPHPADARRRTGAQLAVRGTQGVLRAHGAADAPDGRHPRARRRGAGGHGAPRRRSPHDRPQRPLPLRQRQEVQALLRRVAANLETVAGVTMSDRLEREQVSRITR